MPARILQGDVLSVLPSLPADHYDCAVTSPPYWMLRDYGTGTWEGGNDPACEHKVRGPAGLASSGLSPISKERGAVNHSQERYRDLCGKCGARRMDRQLGLEPTPEDYVANMVRVFAEVRRVLAPWGVCWCNIGDCYSGGGPHHGGSNLGKTATNPGSAGGTDRFPPGLAPGNLALIPWRLALALQADGWTVRSVVVWHKPSPMPASLSGWRWQRCRVKVKDGTMRRADATKHRPPLPLSGNGHIQESAGKVAQWADCPGCDKCSPHSGYVLRRGSWRCTSSWEPLLMLVKSGRYYGDGESCKHIVPSQYGYRDHSARWVSGEENGDGHRSGGGSVTGGDPSAGANLRDVWTIAAEPLREKHYAAFPTELVYRCLASSTSQRGYCPECGAPWARVVESMPLKRYRPNDYVKRIGEVGTGNVIPQTTAGVENRTLGWRPSCTCGDLEPRPARVLDPFAGSGRVGVQALRMGMDFTGVELSPGYVDMARRILAAESPLFSEVE